MKPAYELLGKPKLLIVDGAGTLFDPGSKIPALAFQAAFESKIGLYLEFDTIMSEMGRQKQEHIRLLLNKPDVLEQFKEKYQRDPDENDVLALYEEFKKQLYPAAAKTEEIPDVKDAAYRSIKAGTSLIMTTGYDRRMVDETGKNYLGLMMFF